ncbi:restriction endonuclease subunit S [Klebsiella pneumoniae]|nr:restriction endonuclease subunit S [Klebsiella pneumoniae]MEA4733006.1 restriction endonuclease subunit S [Klebsiella pneumoniae]
MAKYKAYPEYKDSGVEWLGEIPIHWEMLRHKYVAFFTKGKNPTNLLEQPLKNTLPYLSMECLRNNTTDKYALISNDVRIALEGQPLIIWDGSNAGEFVKGKSGILSSTMAAATLTYPLHPQYYWYVCISIEPEMRKNAVGMGIPHVNGDELKSISFSIPSFCEQKQIAVFLDHETAKIDNLIEKQQQLIELLKEKRQAVVSHAVTKGLNPDVPMKDSGVEWLGNVPEHWEVLSFSRFTRLSQGLQIPQSDRLEQQINGAVEYITIRSINAGAENTQKEYIQSPSQRVICNRDDVLLARTEATGEVVTGVEGVFHNNFFKVSYDHSIDKDFLVHLLQVRELKQHLLMLAGTTTIPDLNHGAFLSTKVPLPSKSEQKKIVAVLREKIARCDSVLRKNYDAIRLLRERRTALISAAVTGKIDVRDWVAPDTQDVEASQEAIA